MPSKAYKLKLSLLKSGIKLHICEKCNLTTWLDQSIPLEVHHIDGNNENNELCNIQLLCPNCHSITDTYGGKNKKSKPIRKITDTEIIEAVESTYNKRQALLKLGLTGIGGNYQRITRIMRMYNVSFKDPKAIKEEALKKLIEDHELKIKADVHKKYSKITKQRKTKIEWPSKEELEELIKKLSILEISKQLKVSDNSVRKRAKKYGIKIKEISPFSHKNGLSKKEFLCVEKDLNLQAH